MIAAEVEEVLAFAVARNSPDSRLVAVVGSTSETPEELLARHNEELDGRVVAARELFFRYDGSRFSMSRDGLEEEYLAHRVPDSLEVEWTRELTGQYARSLSGSYDWRALNFFVSHGDTSHDRLAVRTSPAGKLLDQIIDFEMLARYLDTAPDLAISDAETQTALKQTIAYGMGLRATPRSDRSRARLESVLAALASHVGGCPRRADRRCTFGIDSDSATPGRARRSVSLKSARDTRV